MTDEDTAERNYPQYFDVDGAPARMEAPDVLPELFNGEEWVTCDLVRIMFATPLDKEKFDSLMKATIEMAATDEG
jgi:hypothetical protein